MARDGREMVRTQVGREFGVFQQDPSGDSLAATDAAVTGTWVTVECEMDQSERVVGAEAGGFV